MSMQTGKQSICFETPPYIVSSASIVGKKEGEGPLGACFDLIGEDDKFGQDTWEEAESTLQKEAFGMAVGKAGLITRCRSLACMVRAVPAARRFPLEQCVLLQDMQITLWR